MSSSAHQWISTNLSITGFTEATSAFMTCKELVENALDATVSVDEAVINLHIDESGDYLQICSQDNGTGFMVDSVEALVNVFQSTRSVTEGGTCGKFGVGLKAMAYMSHTLGGGKQITIRSPLQGTDSSVSFSLGVLASGEIEISDAELGEHVECTSITVWAPRPSAMDKFCKDFREYLSELTIFRVGIRITFSVNDDEEDVFAHLSAGVPKSVKHKDPSGLVECVVSISQRNNLSDDSIKMISLIRFVNGVPLLSANACGCNLLQAAALVIARTSASMGLELSQEAFTTSSVIKCSRNVRVSSPDSTWHHLTVRVNLIQPSCRVEYSSLLKEAVVGITRQEGAPTLQVIVSRAVKGGLKRIQNRFRNQFQSNEEYEHSRALKFYIPIIAKNLSEAAGRVSNNLFRERLSDIFTSELLSDQSQLESKLNCILTETLGNSASLDSRSA